MRPLHDKFSWKILFNSSERSPFNDRMKQLNDVYRYRLKSRFFSEEELDQQVPNGPNGVNSSWGEYNSLHHIKGYVQPIGIRRLRISGKFSVICLFTSRKEYANRFFFSKEKLFSDYFTKYLDSLKKIHTGIRKSFTLLLFEFEAEDNMNKIFLDFISMFRGTEIFLITQKLKRSSIFSRNLLKSYTMFGNTKNLNIVKLAIRNLSNNAEICSENLDDKSNKIFRYASHDKESRKKLLSPKGQLIYKWMWNTIDRGKTVRAKITLFDICLKHGLHFNIHKESGLKREFSFKPTNGIKEIRPINLIFDVENNHSPLTYDCKHGIMMLIHFLWWDSTIERFQLRFFNTENNPHSPDHVGLIIHTKEGQILRYDSVRDVSEWDTFTTFPDWDFINKKD